MKRATSLLVLIVACAGAAGGAYWYRSSGGSDQFADCRKSTAGEGAALIGGPFSLIDGNGGRHTEADVIDRPTLVYFGYTFCPDICPTDMSRNAIALDLLKTNGTDVNLVFISVDPDRDSPEVILDFASSFHPDALALTGSPEEIAAAAKAYRVYYAKSGDDPEYYTMDHSTFTYLMAPDAGFLEFFGSNVSAENMAETVGCYAEHI